MFEDFKSGIKIFYQFLLLRTIIIPLVVTMGILDFVAGSCGGAVGIFVGYPFDTVKVLIQNQTLPVKYTSTFQTIFKVINDDGVKRLYRYTIFELNKILVFDLD